MLLCSVSAAQGVVVWSGGVGTDERESAPTTGTKLVFFVESGSFLSGVQVLIKNANGAEVVNTVSTGPWLILNLPSGRYQVTATRSEGNAQGGYIDVDGSNQEFAYMFRE
jgi:hypothetical protein